MEDRLEEQGVGLPLRERVAEQVDDRRADVHRVEVRVDRRDVEGERHVLDELPVAALEGVAAEPVARLRADVGEQADDGDGGKGGEQVAGGEADRERDEDRDEVRGDEAAGAEQGEVHRLNIGICAGRD